MRSRRAGSSASPHRYIRVTDWKNQSNRTGQTDYKVDLSDGDHEAHLRRPLRGRARPGHRRRALGAARRARAAARPQALHRPARGAAARRPRHPRPAPARARGVGRLRRGTLPPPAGSRIYELTERGQQLEPVVLALGRFGSVAPFPPGEAQIGVDALVIALKTLFAPDAADGLSASYELRLGEQHFRAARWPTGGSTSPAGAPRRPTRSSRPTRQRSPPCCGTAATPTRRAAPATWSSAATRTAVTRLLGLFPLPS